MKRSLCDMNEVNLILFFLEEGPIEPPPPFIFYLIRQSLKRKARIYRQYLYHNFTFLRAKKKKEKRKKENYNK